MTSWLFNLLDSVFRQVWITVYGVEDFKTAREMAKEQFKRLPPRGDMEWCLARLDELYNEKVNNEINCRIDDGIVLMDEGFR